MQNNREKPEWVDSWNEIKENVLILGCFKLVLLLLCIGMFMAMAIIISHPEERTERIGIEHYGNYTGTNNDAMVHEYIDSFFPEKIEPYFSDVTFIYRATDIGSYACEAYLEFTIEDPEIFRSYVNGIGDGAEWHPFPHDNSFMEYSLADTIYLCMYNENTDNNRMLTSVVITDAKIGKILYSSETQEVIYTAILVCNDSVGDTSFFDAFFERFGIEPTAYTKKIDILE